MSEAFQLADAGRFAEAAALAERAGPDQSAASLVSVFSRWALEQPVPAAAAALALSDPATRNLVWHSVTGAWSTRDPAALAAYAWPLSEAAPRNQAISTALNAWLERDQSAALAWAGNLPSDGEHDIIVALVAQNPGLIRDKTDLALAWAETIRNPALRSRVLGRVVREWRETEPGAAEHFARHSADLTPSEREDILVGERFTAHP